MDDEEKKTWTRIIFHPFTNKYYRFGGALVYEFICKNPSYQNLCEIIWTLTNERRKGYFCKRLKLGFIRFFSEKCIKEYGFTNMKPDGIIKPNTIDGFYEFTVDQDCLFIEVGREKYTFEYGDKKPVCPMLIENNKNSSDDNKECKEIKEIKENKENKESNCWYVNAAENNNTDCDEKELLDHLQKYRHFNEYSVRIGHGEAPICKLHDACPIFNKMINGNDKNVTVKDKIHFYLTSHMSCGDDNRTKQKQDNNGGVHSFDCLPQGYDGPVSYMRQFGMILHQQPEIGGGDHRFLIPLINEVIRNGFEKDLLPRKKLNNNNNNNGKVDKKYSIHTSISKLICEYGIFDLIFDKLNHSRHNKMGRPLRSSFDCMLALILYSQGDCNYDMTKSLRNNDNKKWQMFDLALILSIVMLGFFESHTENIYSGLHNVQLNKNVDCIKFKTFQSFSKSYRVAKMFCRSKGMIIGLNIRHLQNFHIKHTSINPFGACDISWISKYWREEEVLVSRISPLPIDKKKIYYRKNKELQYLICDPKSSFNELNFV